MPHNTLFLSPVWTVAHAFVIHVAPVPPLTVSSLQNTFALVSFLFGFLVAAALSESHYKVCPFKCL